MICYGDQETPEERHVSEKNYLAWLAEQSGSTALITDGAALDKAIADDHADATGESAQE